MGQGCRLGDERLFYCTLYGLKSGTLSHFEPQGKGVCKNFNKYEGSLKHVMLSALKQKLEPIPIFNLVVCGYIFL